MMMITNDDDNYDDDNYDDDNYDDDNYDDDNYDDDVFYKVSHQCTNNGGRTVQHLALLNQRYRADRWYIYIYIQYMVLLQEFLHPPRASRDDCGERITQKSIPLRVAKFL